MLLQAVLFHTFYGWVAFRCMCVCVCVCVYSGVPGGTVVKKPPASAGDAGVLNSIPGSGRSPGEGNGDSLLYSWLKTSHGQRSLAGFRPWGCKESDTTEQLSIQCAYIHHIFFTRSSVVGHLCCFCVLAIVNSAAVNIGVHVSFQIMVFSLW